MKYYIIKAELAGILGLTAYRYGNREAGYLVNQGDLVMCDMGQESDNGQLKEVSVSQARQFVNKL